MRKGRPIPILTVSCRRARNAGALGPQTENGPGTGPTSADHSQLCQRQDQHRSGDALADFQTDGWQMAERALSVKGSTVCWMSPDRVLRDGSVTLKSNEC